MLRELDELEKEGTVGRWSQEEPFSTELDEGYLFFIRKTLTSLWKMNKNGTRETFVTQ